MRTPVTAAFVLLAICGSAEAQSAPQTIYQPNGTPAITLYSGGGYTLYAPDGMTVTESAPSTPSPAPYSFYAPGDDGSWDLGPAPDATLLDPPFP